MRLLSVHVGRPTLLVKNGRRYSTSINKQSVQHAMELRTTGLFGDRCADANHHGSMDQAVCCYPNENYDYFETILERMLPRPSFGENFTTVGLMETEVAIGDTLQIGSAKVQISQPRQPCWKLANKLDDSRTIEWIESTGLTGFYLRVIEEGVITPGSDVQLLERPQPTWTVARVFQLMRSKAADIVIYEQLGQLRELSESWRRRFMSLAGRLGP